jgi:hypothetical protein
MGIYYDEGKGEMGLHQFLWVLNLAPRIVVVRSPTSLSPYHTGHIISTLEHKAKTAFKRTIARE